MTFRKGWEDARGEYGFKERMKSNKDLREAINLYIYNPPGNEFQRGHLLCLLTLLASR